jgi:hypothetical protein
MAVTKITIRNARCEGGPVTSADGGASAARCSLFRQRPEERRTDRRTPIVRANAPSGMINRAISDVIPIRPGASSGPGNPAPDEDGATDAGHRRRSINPSEQVASDEDPRRSR